MMVYMLAIRLANSTPGFYDIKNAGAGDHASNQYMKDLRALAKETFGCDLSEKRVCKDTKHAFDFYIPEEATAIEVALSLRNPTSEYERGIFKCLLAREDGLPIRSLVFISKPGALSRHEAAGSRPIRDLVMKHFGVWVDIMELLPNAQPDKIIETMNKTASSS